MDALGATMGAFGLDAFPEGRLRSGATITMDAFGVGAFPEGRLSLWTALPRSGLDGFAALCRAVRNLFFQWSPEFIRAGRGLLRGLP